MTQHRSGLPGIEARTIASNRTFPRHSHDQLGIGVMLSGGHRSWSGLGQVEARAGDVIMVNPGEMHDGLPAHLRRLTTRHVLVGTWADAEWAIRFYQRHGFELVSPGQKTSLLDRYWTVSRRQIETSVVLANPPLSAT